MPAASMASLPSPRKEVRSRTPAQGLEANSCGVGLTDGPAKYTNIGTLTVTPLTRPQRRRHRHRPGEPRDDGARDSIGGRGAGPRRCRNRLRRVSQVHRSHRQRPRRPADRATGHAAHTAEQPTRANVKITTPLRPMPVEGQIQSVRRSRCRAGHRTPSGRAARPRRCRPRSGETILGKDRGGGNARRRRVVLLWLWTAHRPRSPPLALECRCGPARPVERIELLHVTGGELEVEDLRVLRDALAVGRLRDDRDAALHAPAQQDRGRASTDALCDARHHRVAEQCAGAQRAVGLERDTAFCAGVRMRAVGRTG